MKLIVFFIFLGIWNAYVLKSEEKFTNLELYYLELEAYILW
jgi:hypothetical protein